MKSLFTLLLLLLAAAALAAGPFLLNRPLLQSDMDAGGYAVTNAISLRSATVDFHSDFSAFPSGLVLLGEATWLSDSNAVVWNGCSGGRKLYYSTFDYGPCFTVVTGTVMSDPSLAGGVRYVEALLNGATQASFTISATATAHFYGVFSMPLDSIAIRAWADAGCGSNYLTSLSIQRDFSDRPMVIRDGVNPSRVPPRWHSDVMQAVTSNGFWRSIGTPDTNSWRFFSYD